MRSLSFRSRRSMSGHPHLPASFESAASGPVSRGSSQFVGMSANRRLTMRWTRTGFPRFSSGARLPVLRFFFFTHFWSYGQPVGQLEHYDQRLSLRFLRSFARASSAASFVGPTPLHSPSTSEPKIVPIGAVALHVPSGSCSTVVSPIVIPISEQQKHWIGSLGITVSAANGGSSRVCVVESAARRR